MSGISRIQCPVLRDRVMTAEEAAELIPNGATVGMSGFTGAGYPKAIPGALAKRIGKINETGGRSVSTSGPVPRLLRNWTVHWPK